MTARTERHYVRVYHDDLMRDYPESWGDDAILATWLRLLVIADKMWPAMPELPRSVKPRPLSALVSVGLVELVGSHGYRVRGLDAERTRRRDAARNAAASRWDVAAAVPSTESESETETKVVTLPTASSGREAPPAAGDDAWTGFDHRWLPFRAAMASRGFTRPPTEPQREMLWEIVDGNPHRAAAWLLKAPAGSSFAAAIGHVLDEWHDLKRSVPSDPVPARRIAAAQA